MDENKEKDKSNDIEVVTGDGKNLDISAVYDHIKIDKPDTPKNKDKKIVIPNEKK
jgi:hypothetical protein